MKKASKADVGRQTESQPHLDWDASSMDDAWGPTAVTLDDETKNAWRTIELIPTKRDNSEPATSHR